MELENKKIAVLGLGEENIALIKYLARNGIKNITVCDKKSKKELDAYLENIKDFSLQYKFGDDYLDNLDQFDIVFRTPGLSYLTNEIQLAKINGLEISSQTKLFFNKCPCPIIGVTGTKGKGTTSTLIYEILKKSDHDVYLGGNIGLPPIEFLDKLNRNSVVVLELSSFQLQDLEQSPHISVVLNIASDHLDVHADRGEYVQAKSSIIRYQKKEDFACINADYLTSFEFAAQTSAKIYWFSRHKSVDQGAWIKNKNELLLSDDDKIYKISKTKDITLRGEHNWENIAAASVASFLAGAKVKTIAQTIKEFKGLEHRLEFVREFDNVRFYNDSFSTTPETTIAAINSFPEPIILIAGGSEKNADYTELGRVINRSNVKLVISIGVTGSRIKAEINNPNIKIVDSAKNFDDVFEIIKSEMTSGDVVLLSPASASFDWFANYKDRGKKFKEKVMDIKP
jgi:UDP-N-acetylmuramoylalanine--D-glutamate ligase